MYPDRRKAVYRILREDSRLGQGTLVPVDGRERRLVLSGVFASVSGVMWAYYNGFVSPTYLDLTASSELFLMVTLGGPATLIGPVVGAGAIVLLKNVISAYTARWLLILGIVYIVAILGAPQGLWNLGRKTR